MFLKRICNLLSNPSQPVCQAGFKPDLPFVVLAGKAQRRGHHAPPVAPLGVAQQNAQGLVVSRRNDLAAVHPLREGKDAKLRADRLRKAHLRGSVLGGPLGQVQVVLHDLRRLHPGGRALQQRRKGRKDRVADVKLDLLLRLRVVVGEDVDAHEVSAAHGALQVRGMLPAHGVDDRAQKDER